MVIATGAEIPKDQLRPLPSQVLLRPYVPQLAVLRRAALFITHAGTNGVYESLLAGVPMLMLPQGGDQPLIAEQIEQARLGRWLPESELTPDRLHAEIDGLLSDPDLRSRVREAGDVLRLAGGLPKVVALVNAFVEQLGAR